MRRVNLAEQKAQLEGRFLRGRQIALMIFEYFRVTGAHESVLDCSDLFRIALQGDDQSMKFPQTTFLERLYKMRERESDQLKTVLAIFEQEINQHISQPYHQKLKRCMDQKTRARNIEARNERIEIP